MQTMSIQQSTPAYPLHRAWMIGIIFILLAAAGIYFYQEMFAAPAFAALSQQALAEKAGLQVNLLAVTAAGGKVDLRLKVIDAPKAQEYFKDAGRFPVLVMGNGRTLSIPSADREAIKVRQDGLIMLLFANTGGAVKPGDAVFIQFGNERLDAVTVK